MDSDNVSTFDPDRLKPHTSGRARCVGCRHEWQAVVPYDKRRNWFECPACGDMRGRYFGGYDPAPGNTGGGVQFVCTCGNDLFHILPGAVTLCANCGAESDAQPT